MRHFLDIDDISSEELSDILDIADTATKDLDPILAGSGVGCIFEKPSLRTKHSMALAIQQLGGYPVVSVGTEVGIDDRELIEDVGQVLAGYHKMLALRVFDHNQLERLASLNLIPIINMLSNRAHPLQALADVLTMRREFGSVEGLKVAYVGDANNVARSLAIAVGLLGGEVSIASPAGYEFSDADLTEFIEMGVKVSQTSSPEEAVIGADVIYTDVWFSMGQESERESRLKAFESFRVDSELASLNPNAIIMHDLPAHRGEEISDEVIDGPQSRVFVQSHNRVDTARALMYWIATEEAKENNGN